ncbi:hypothetical protein CDAR_580741 [Caerostris darwini]|uniref:Uncharacterized protein n=1 Tax=Caerostris darwini TaxID=1538125 RepID=A0AAV4TW98_9ARAC|nr:hypothetical protein CDAR_580741 [Caerostris darwini]
MNWTNTFCRPPNRLNHQFLKHIVACTKSCNSANSLEEADNYSLSHCVLGGENEAVNLSFSFKPFQTLHPSKDRETSEPTPPPPPFSSPHYSLHQREEICSPSLLILGEKSFVDLEPQHKVRFLRESLKVFDVYSDVESWKIDRPLNGRGISTLHPSKDRESSQPTPPPFSSTHSSLHQREEICSPSLLILGEKSSVGLEPQHKVRFLRESLKVFEVYSDVESWEIVRWKRNFGRGNPNLSPFYAYKPLKFHQAETETLVRIYSELAKILSEMNWTNKFCRPPNRMEPPDSQTYWGLHEALH